MGMADFPADDLQVFEFDGFSAEGLFISHQQFKIFILHLFFPVGHFEEFLINLLQFFTFDLISQVLQAMFESSPSAAGGKGNDRFADAYIHRIDDLIVFTVFQHTVLVYAR